MNNETGSSTGFRYPRLKTDLLDLQLEDKHKGVGFKKDGEICTANLLSYSALETKGVDCLFGYFNLRIKNLNNNKNQI